MILSSPKSSGPKESGSSWSIVQILCEVESGVVETIRVSRPNSRMNWRQIPQGVPEFKGKVCVNLEWGI